MQHLNKLFGLVTGVVASMISLNVSAQDMGCGNCADYGTYRLGTQTAIINHYFGCPNCNDADPNGAYNFIGGSNSQDFTGSGSQVAENSIAYGDGARVGGNQSVAFGENVDNPEDNAFVFGKSITALGLETFTVGWSSVEFGISSGASTIPEGVFMAEPQSGKVGIGTTSPGNAKLTIEGNGGSSSTNPALLIKDAGSNRRLNLRNDGWTGLSNDPGAPYYFTETNKSPFQAGTDGEANIVQNYNSFPFFASSSSNSTSSAKWLALGERPPASNLDAYGLGNVWDNFAGNFFLLENPNTSNPTIKDLAISFQDVGPNGDLTNPDAARNRIRFLFRNKRDIDASQPSVFELMSLEPTGEVGIGDYTNSTQQANLEVKSESNNNGDPVFQVRKNASASGRGDLVMTANDDGQVGIGLNNPSAELEVTTDDPIKATGGDWAGASDERLKKNINNYKDGLKELMEIRPVWYQFNSKMDHLNSDEKHVGVIAQETKEIAPYMVEKSYKVDGKSYYSLNSTAFTYMLINAVQEQQKELEGKDEQIEKLQKRDQQQQQAIEELREKYRQLTDGKEANQFKKSGKEDLNQKTVSIGESGQQEAMLLQNRPNPYKNETIIPYYLPGQFQSASIVISSTNGRLIERIDLQNPGKGEVTLQTGNLEAGQYVYTLIIDGRKKASRKMIKK